MEISLVNTNNRLFVIHEIFSHSLQVMEAFSKAEIRKKCNPETMFDDVYDEIPDHIREQKEQMVNHVNQYKEHYPLKLYEKMSSGWGAVVIVNTVLPETSSLAQHWFREL